MIYLLFAAVALGAYIYVKKQFDGEEDEQVRDVPESLGDVQTGYLDGVPFQLSLSPLNGAPGYYLEGDAASAFNAMYASAAADGVTLQVNSAFRTMEKQRALVASEGAYLQGGLAARPGFSPHQRGDAVDIESGGGTNEAYQWLEANRSRFGFVNPRPLLPGLRYEAWHNEFRPIETGYGLS